LEKGDIHTKLWSIIVKRREYFVDLGVDWRIILKWIFRKYGGNWMNLAHDRDR
jgi:hypothetical protein